MQSLEFKGLSRGIVRRGETLAPHTTIKIGGPADYWIEPFDISELASVMDQISRWKIPWMVLGGGSNVLFSDRGFRGAVISLRNSGFQQFSDADGIIRAGAGLALPIFLKKLVENGYGECEFLYGIPAEVGGAAVMNAGSADRWIGDHIQSVQAVTGFGEIINIGLKDLCFTYRKSNLNEIVVTEIVIQFPKIDPSVTRANLEAYAQKRRQTQDLKYPSCGCMFMNPNSPGKSAGQLIDECGLKGASVGGAMVSKVHANFLVNTGSATSADVAELMDLVKQNVVQKHGISLHQEMKYIGESSE